MHKFGQRIARSGQRSSRSAGSSSGCRVRNTGPPPARDATAAPRSTGTASSRFQCKERRPPGRGSCPRQGRRGVGTPGGRRDHGGSSKAASGQLNGAAPGVVVVDLGVGRQRGRASRGLKERRAQDPALQSRPRGAAVARVVNEVGDAAGAGRPRPRRGPRERAGSADAPTGALSHFAAKCDGVLAEALASALSNRGPGANLPGRGRGSPRARYPRGFRVARGPPPGCESASQYPRQRGVGGFSGGAGAGEALLPDSASSFINFSATFSLGPLTSREVVTEEPSFHRRLQLVRRKSLWQTVLYFEEWRPDIAEAGISP